MASRAEKESPFTAFVRARRAALVRAIVGDPRAFAWVTRGAAEPGQAVAAAADEMVAAQVMRQWLAALRPGAERGEVAELEALLAATPAGAQALAALQSEEGFRYAELRPAALQDAYEASLGAMVALCEDGGVITPIFGESARTRKELGAYYTDARLCHFLVEATLGPVFAARQATLREAIECNEIGAATAALNRLLAITICDPTMGAGPFLRAAFAWLAEHYASLRRLTEAIAPSHPALGSPAQWEHHVIGRMLYGVDLDPGAVATAQRCFAVTPRLPLAMAGPSPLGLTLRTGNALIGPLAATDRAAFAAEHRAEIAALVRLRQSLLALPLNERRADPRLERAIARLRDPLIAARVAPRLGAFTAELRPFAWEMEFPEVFFTADGALKDDPGFDVILGNPPWEAFRPRDKEFFDAVEPGFRFQSRPARDRARARLLANPAIADRHAHYCASIEAQRRFVLESGLYRLQAPVVNGERRSADVNLFKCTLERALDLAAPKSGRIGLVLQSGITRDLGSRDLRRACVEGGRVTGLWELHNRAGGETIFPGVDLNQRFVVLALARGEAADAVPYRHCRSLAELGAPGAAVPLALTRRISGDAFEWQTLEEPAWIAILEKLHRHPRLDDARRRHLRATLRRELDTDKHAGLFRDQPTGVPLWEGSLVGRCSIAPAPRRWVDPEAFAPLARDAGQPRVVIRRILPNSARRIYAGLVPAGVACADSLSYVVPGPSLRQQLFLLALLNSMVVEHRLLQTITGMTLSHYRVEALPVPDWPEDDPRHRAVVARAAALVALDPRFSADFARAGLALEAAPDRAAAEAALDAEIAAAYGLTHDELGRIVAAFPKVDARARAAVLAAFAARAPA